MSRSNDAQAVAAVVNRYIKGTADSDVELLKSTFDEKAVMCGYMGPDLLLGGPEPFFAAIGQRRVEAEYVAEIIEISVVGRTATAVIVEDNLYGGSFVTKFHLLEVEGAWTIVAKLFHHD